MQVYQYKILINGNLSKKGLGFSCMRMAYENNISGTLYYESANSAVIEITGSEKAAINFIEQCKTINYINEIHTLNKTQTIIKHTDFIMLNQID